ncbi:uncharacterized protein BDR25DRAFT_236038 [Lindgomyces ingoldianus]|uniref:Uncharacterized protein n=1 Tax=Lindgomyces ingoldianus TaxID=673940 RepID=A0ACB6QIZ5_9PLEO|nr:uncharacterized protein BDR25DRAFT_236038 [Lindgomyces ingoldianus]KAF2466860.1 hypothetical protein BDR25DRAFT_236038 [Lindgomyces ingoldianus]
MPTLLDFSLLPIGLHLVVSLTALILCAHSWYLLDWKVLSWVWVLFNQTNKIEQAIIEYTFRPTDTTISAGCLGVASAVVAIIGWSRLRMRDMDFEYNITRRYFWSGFVLLTSAASFACSLAALIFSTIDKDSGGWQGCTQTIDGANLPVFHCTREAAACSLLPYYWANITGEWKWAIPLACNEAVSAKWMQVAIMLCTTVVIAMFGAQAWLRRGSHRSVGKEAA